MDSRVSGEGGSTSTKTKAWGAKPCPSPPSTSPRETRRWIWGCRLLPEAPATVPWVPALDPGCSCQDPSMCTCRHAPVGSTLHQRVPGVQHTGGTLWSSPHTGHSCACTAPRAESALLFHCQTYKTQDWGVKKLPPEASVHSTTPGHCWPQPGPVRDHLQGLWGPPRSSCAGLTSLPRGPRAAGPGGSGCARTVPTHLSVPPSSTGQLPPTALPGPRPSLAWNEMPIHLAKLARASTEGEEGLETWPTGRRFHALRGSLSQRGGPQQNEPLPVLLHQRGSARAPHA